MGQAVSSTPEPVYKMLAQRTGYEIRAYAPYVVAEVSNPSGDNNSFRILASYIGVFRTPQNKMEGTGQSEAISMTAPVIMPGAVAIPMTAPVVIDGDVMQFVMPDKYKKASDLPTPTDERVKLRDVADKRVAVLRFSGRYSRENCGDKVQELRQFLKSDKLLEDTSTPCDWSYCGYNPPFTPGPFRRNEVWIDLKMTEEGVMAKFPTPTGGDTKKPADNPQECTAKS